MPVDSVTLNMLAGPMMRRLTGTSVAVWLALSQGSDVVRQVFDAALAAACRSSILARGELAGSVGDPKLMRSKDATSIANFGLAAGAGRRVPFIRPCSGG